MADAVGEVVAWQAICEAMAGFDVDLERAFAAPAPELAALFRRTRSRLETLRETLRKQGLSETDRDDVLRPLAFLVDERVLTRLSGDPLTEQQQWPLVQRAVVNELFGGDEFFAAADELRARAPVPRFQLEVYLYCLERGFVGQYADAPEALERYRALLWEPLEKELPAPLATTQGSAVRVPQRRGLAQFWLLAALGCTVVAAFYASIAGFGALFSRTM
jgi:type IV/VI secretion system ImpK/VasF family protein